MKEFELFRGLTRGQKNALDRIAIGDDSCINSKVVAELLRRELVIETEQILGGGLPVRIKRYHMPIHVHIQWCAWCSQRLSTPQLDALDARAKKLGVEG